MTRIELNASLEPLSIPAGEATTLSTDAGGAGLPQYGLFIGNTALSVLGYSDDDVRSAPVDGFTVVAVSSNMSSAGWVVRADIPGTYTVKVGVTGEVSAGRLGHTCSHMARNPSH